MDHRDQGVQIGEREPKLRDPGRIGAPREHQEEMQHTKCRAVILLFDVREGAKQPQTRGKGFHSALFKEDRVAARNVAVEVAGEGPSEASLEEMTDELTFVREMNGLGPALGQFLWKQRCFHRDRNVICCPTRESRVMGQEEQDHHGVAADTQVRALNIENEGVEPNGRRGAWVPPGKG